MNVVTGSEALLAAVAAGVGSLLTAVVSGLLQRRKMSADVVLSEAQANAATAETARQQVETALSLVDPLNARIERLQTALDEAETRAEALTRQLVEVTAELHAARLEIKRLRDDIETDAADRHHGRDGDT